MKHRQSLFHVPYSLSPRVPGALNLDHPLSPAILGSQLKHLIFPASPAVLLRQTCSRVPPHSIPQQFPPFLPPQHVPALHLPAQSPLSLQPLVHLSLSQSPLFNPLCNKSNPPQFLYPLGNNFSPSPPHPNSKAIVK